MPEPTIHAGPHDTYTSPLAGRNASPEMLRLWSPRHKFNTWRRIWLAIAEAQHEVTKDWGGASEDGNDTAGRARCAREGPGAKKTLAGASGSRGPLVTKEQVEELRAVVERGITDAEIARAAELERELRHDVMAHVHCLGEQCPKARAIIHLGCTSQDVVCNADLLVIKEALRLLIRKTVATIMSLADRAKDYAKSPVLGFTHYQSAQPLTVGRRLAGYANDLSIVNTLIENNCDFVRPRGLRGATGTQAAFAKLFVGGKAAHSDVSTMLKLVDSWSPAGLATNSKYQYKQTVRRVIRGLFGRDSLPLLNADCDAYEILMKSGVARSVSYDTFRVYESQLKQFIDECKDEIAGKIQSSASGESHSYELEEWGWPLVEEIFLQKISFLDQPFALTGQTYPRAVDAIVLGGLASVASVLHKIATDIRLLSNRKELDEPFGKSQIGSSAMPYKRNPMKCERICGLSRFVMNLVGNAYDTAATQWLERTLDDSSNRRLSLPEAFLALDGALDLMHEVASGLVVHEAMVRKNLMAELPFLATENILMEAVKLGGDRQDLHERIRVHAQAAGMRVKSEGLDNDLIERLRADPAFASVHHLLTEEHLLDPMQYVGRSVEQTERFLAEVIEPLRERYADELKNLGSSDRGV
jgi:Adenylosuccinate lyase